MTSLTQHRPVQHHQAYLASTMTTPVRRSSSHSIPPYASSSSMSPSPPSSPSPMTPCSSVLSSPALAFPDLFGRQSESSPPTSRGQSGRTHYRQLSRELWHKWGLGNSKSPSRDELEDVTAVDESLGMILPSLRLANVIQGAVSIVLPLALPTCTLQAAFQASDTNEPVPPAFYPGQAIPTILTFQLDRSSTLPHSLNPTLTMSLVGTLHIPKSPPRTIICVSVSLAEGLELWARDARNAYANRLQNEIDVDQYLPGGTYSLPLTVQVPSTPKLAPSFTVRGAKFAVTYALTVTLACDDPLRSGNRAVLAEAARPFEMMPETLPTRSPRYTESHFFVRSEGQHENGVIGTAKGLMRRPNSRWTVFPSLPTTAYSPTSLIPLSINLIPPQDQPDVHYQILLRLALTRREHSSLSISDVSTGLVAEEEVASRWGWIETTDNTPKFLKDITLPLMPDQTWQHGFSTILNVGPPANSTSINETISVSSTFHLSVVVAFLHITPGGPTLQDVIDRPLPPVGTFTIPVADHGGMTVEHIRNIIPGTVKNFPLAIVVGSVSEPRSAMHTIQWSDLHLDRSSGWEESRIISGEAMSCENGWMLPPPAYHEAIEQVPYDFA